MFSIQADKSFLISVVYFNECVFNVNQKVNKHIIKI